MATNQVYDNREMNGELFENNSDLRCPITNDILNMIDGLDIQDRQLPRIRSQERVNFYEEEHADEFHEEDHFYDASPYFIRTRDHVQAEEEERMSNQTRNETLIRRERCIEECDDFDVNNYRGNIRENYYESGRNRRNLMQNRTRSEHTYTSYSRRPCNIGRDDESRRPTANATQNLFDPTMYDNQSFTPYANFKQASKIDLTHINIFTGRGEDLETARDLTILFQELEDYFYRRNLSEEDKIIYLKQKLAQEPKEILIDERPKTYLRAKEILISVFVPEIKGEEIAAKIKLIKRRENERFEQFARRILALSRLVANKVQLDERHDIIFKPSAEALLQCFPENIHGSDSIRMAKRNKDMRYLIEILKEFVENDPEIWKKQRNIKNIRKVEIKNEVIEQRKGNSAEHNKENFPSKYLPKREFNYNQICCKFCGKLNHSEEYCWIKYPNKRPSNKFGQERFQYTQRQPYTNKANYGEHSCKNTYLNREQPDDRQYYPTVSYREGEKYTPREKITNINNMQNNVNPYSYRNNRKDF